MVRESKESVQSTYFDGDFKNAELRLTKISGSETFDKS